MTEANFERKQFNHKQQELLDAFQGQERDLLEAYLTGSTKGSTKIELTRHAKGIIYKELVTNLEKGGYDKSDAEQLADMIDYNKIRNMSVGFEMSDPDEQGNSHPVIVFSGEVKVEDKWQKRNYKGVGFSPSRFLQRKETKE
ncbi:hypothetical protein GYA19_02665 [Candidatus Beckwithbacteria bacterium]|nr:hypothetical protein [Candidatus Beckwithbacteria bacterium]